MITNRFGVLPLASLLSATLMSSVVFAQATPPPQAYPDPNAQPQYPQQQQPQQPQQYQQQPGYPPPQQQQYPQQPEYQQQPGYPPQQPQQPGYPPQQPGYPQQQPYPPPGYAPPPGYGPPPGYAPPPPPMGHRGALVMGYLGINSFQGITGNGVGPGFRLGGLVGFYASPVLSLNGELSIDFLNLDSGTFGADTTGVRASLSLAPLYHIPTQGNFELVVGPKLGVWDEELSNSNDGTTISASGYLVGFNVGGFARFGNNTLFGGLFSFEAAVPTKACAPDFTGAQSCGTPTDNTAEKVLAFNLAALF